MSALRAIVNGTPVDLAEGTTVADVVRLRCVSDRGVAVALDRNVVPRSLWSSTVVTAGQHLEIVSAAAGG
jgi:sulfur carrier protein